MIAYIKGNVEIINIDSIVDEAYGVGYEINFAKPEKLTLGQAVQIYIYEHIREDDFSDAFVKMVAELAGAIGVNVCVEGVENKRQFDFIKKMKIKYIQGYYFGKPVPLKEFEKKYL